MTITCASAAMSSVLNKVKVLVSKNKRRYQEGEYDLDLTYIRPNLIAMGFPSDKLEGVYRNHIDHVVKLLEEKHKDHYKVYNLCSERTYDGARFHNRVAHYPFDDHNPPKIELIQPFCEDVDSWLAKDKQNVAVIHCKAGKGRTGVMICAYLLHRGEKRDASDALSFYAESRTSDKKGVTIPSQKRYVCYYDQLIKMQPLQYKETPLFLQGIKLHPIPNFPNLTPQIVIWQTSSSKKCSITKINESIPLESVSRFEREICLQFPEKVPVSGDTLVAVFNNPRMLRKERMFQFWFNTYFVTDKGSDLRNGTSSSPYCRMTDHPRYTTDTTSRVKRWPSQPDANDRKLRAAESFSFDDARSLVLRLPKFELDKANKDKSHKLFNEHFEVVCYFEKVATDAERQGATSVPSKPVVQTSISVAGGESGLALDENLSDTETDNECSDEQCELRGSDV